MKEFKSAPMTQSPGDETIYGYPIRDLVIFAEACHLAGDVPKELKDFVEWETGGFG